VKVIGRIADGFLGAVVPTIEAHACCSDYGMRYENYQCYAKGIGEKQACTVTCSCRASCGGWIKYEDTNCL
jgi:hypothetical protein